MFLILIIYYSIALFFFFAYIRILKSIRTANREQFIVLFISCINTQKSITEDR